MHAVGPDYRVADDGDALLASAYTEALARAAEAGCRHVAFPLLSAGIFRGTRSLDDVIAIGARALAAAEGVDEVFLVAFLPEERAALLGAVETLVSEDVLVGDGDSGETEL